MSCGGWSFDAKVWIVLCSRHWSAAWVWVGLVLGACPRDSASSGQDADPPVRSPAEPPPAEPPPLADVEPGTLDDDETVAFLPTYAVLRDGVWQVPVDAWVYEPEEGSLSRGAMLELLGEAMQLVPGSPESEVVEHNLRPFVVDDERGQWVAVRRGAHAVRLGPTAPDGRVEGTMPIPQGDPSARGEGTPPWVDLHVVFGPGDDRTLLAWSQLLPDEGISVISDIDDTIKITEVLDKKKMLENTFLRPYRAVPGMAEAYRRWADQGVAFHYVSASPLPLVGALGGFALEAGFPRGSLALRPFRWVDGTAIDLLEPSQSYKREVIGRVFGSFDRRSFVLVGDTGERDPEIYAAFAREHLERVHSIYLRDPEPGGTPGLPARLDAVFEGLPRSLWHVVADGGGLPASL